MKVYDHKCRMCSRIDSLKEAPIPDQKYLCKECFEKVKKAYEQQYPGESLKTKDIVKN